MGLRDRPLDKSGHAMKMNSGLGGAVRLSALCLSILLAPLAANAASGVLTRSEHAHRAVAHNASAARPDFTRASSSARHHAVPKASASPKASAEKRSRAKDAGEKPAPRSQERSSSAKKSREHAAGEGVTKPGSSKTPAARKSRRRRRAEPDDDYAPLPMSRVKSTREKPAPAHLRASSEAPAIAHPAAPYTSGVSHPPAAGEVVEEASARRAPAAAQPAKNQIAKNQPPASRPAADSLDQSPVNEDQIIAAQRAAIGEALRPASAPASATQHFVSAPGLSQNPPVRSAAPAPTPVPAVVAALTDQPQPQRSAIAPRTTTTDSTTAAEDAVRSAAIAPMTRQDIAEAAVAPHLPGLYSREGQLIVPAPLKGSHEVLLHQNEMADAAGLGRIRNDADLDKLRRAHHLVDFPETEGLRVNPELPERRRCARPWTVNFAADMARAFYAEFHEPFTVSSAVRTVSFQHRLQRVNGNAAATSGDAASPHLTGQAFDIGKTGLTLAQIAWLRAYLLPVIESGKIDVEEEFRHACFHISVYPSYAAKPATRTQVAAASME